MNNIPMKTRIPLGLGLKNGGRKKNRLMGWLYRRVGAVVVKRGIPKSVHAELPEVACDVLEDIKGQKYYRFPNGQIEHAP